MKRIVISLFTILALACSGVSILAKDPAPAHAIAASKVTASTSATNHRTTVVPLNSKVAAAPPAVKAPSSGTLRTKVSADEAAKIFRAMAAQKDIAYEYTKDGCYARAHLMAERIKRMGVLPGKLWTFANGNSLSVITGFKDTDHVEWKYHVAVTLTVGEHGKYRTMVIDPSLYQWPVTPAEWRDIQRKAGSKTTPILRFTKLGEAPLLPNGNRAAGNGYWPGPDPTEGFERHAAMMMAKYKNAAHGSR